MALNVLTVLVMLAVAYAFFRQGLLSAFAMTVCVFLAGLVAFNFWEPLADQMEPLLADTFLAGLEDWFCLLAIFCATLLLLRAAANKALPAEPELPAAAQQGGAALFGLLTGYLTAGFLVCVLQTLPWHEGFLGFKPRLEPEAEGAGLRRVLPPDRVWLALVRRASVGPFTAGAEEKGFDPDGSFELRYQRHRRWGDGRDPMPYGGDAEYQPVTRDGRAP
jgi:hypothetical protein